MKETKTRIIDFIKYIEENNISSSRLLYALKSKDIGYFKNVFIEDITDYSLLTLPNVGEKTLTEFKRLKSNYFYYMSIQKKRENKGKLRYEKLEKSKILNRVYEFGEAISLFPRFTTFLMIIQLFTK
jgi:DNA-directed RNA polymerase alpha subunit